jgi:hypothetical protein
MRQFLTSGSVRGVPGDRHSYRDLLTALLKAVFMLFLFYLSDSAILPFLINSIARFYKCLILLNMLLFSHFGNVAILAK